MPIYVAWRDSEVAPTRLAATSLGKLKDKMRPHPGATWAVAKYDLKKDGATMCQAIEDPTELAADEDAGSYRSGDSGRVRKLADEPKKKKKGRA